MAKRAPILIELYEEFCPKERYPGAAAHLMKDRLSVSYPGPDPARAGETTSFEYEGRCDRVLGGERMESLASGLVRTLGAEPGIFEVSQIQTGSTPRCACGHMHVLVVRTWRLKSSKKAALRIHAFSGWADTGETYRLGRERMGPVWDALRAHQAECARQDREAKTLAATEKLSAEAREIPTI